MKIILLKDIANIGRKYDVKDVAEGHALNFLIPRKMAVIATPQAIQKVTAEKSASDAEKKMQADLLVKNLEALKNVVVTLKEKANEKGHLFAGITKDVLIAEIFKQTRLTVDPLHITLDKPIKTTGEHFITVSALGKKAEFKVVIEKM